MRRHVVLVDLARQDLQQRLPDLVARLIVRGARFDGAEGIHPVSDAEPRLGAADVGHALGVQPAAEIIVFGEMAGTESDSVDRLRRGGRQILLGKPPEQVVHVGFALAGLTEVAGHAAVDVVDTRLGDPVAAIMELTEGRGVDVAIEALGRQETFEAALRVLRPGGTLSSLGVYSGKLTLPLEAIAAGLGDHRIVTTLCPGGKERMRRLMNVVRSGRADLRSLVTHRFPLGRIVEAYDLFANQRDGVLKVAITP